MNYYFVLYLVADFLLLEHKLHQDRNQVCLLHCHITSTWHARQASRGCLRKGERDEVRGQEFSISRGPGTRPVEEVLMTEPWCGGKGRGVSRKQEQLEPIPSMLSLTCLMKGFMVAKQHPPCRHKMAAREPTLPVQRVITFP